MRAYLPSYDIVSPTTLDQVLQIMSQEKLRPIAGGTDLMVLLDSGALPAGKYINIWNLPELQGIQVKEDKIIIGALTTYGQIRQNAVMQQEFPNMCRAAEVTGGIAIQNRGTIGGNIANASPAADTPPVLLTYDATVKVVSQQGEKTIPYSDFHLDYKKMCLEPQELIQEIHLPRPQKYSIHHYRKVGTRRAQAISKICISATANVANNVFVDSKIALSSVAPTVIRCYQTEKCIKGKNINHNTLLQAQQTIAREISPIDDIRSNKKYRERVVCNLLEEIFDIAKEQND